MKSLVPLFQILKGFTSLFSRSSPIRGLAVLIVVLPFHQIGVAETIHITPKNSGVPSAWELVSVEPDRIVVRKGGARFEFSSDQIEKVSNPEVSRLIETSQRLLAEVDKHDPNTYSNLETELEKVYPGLENATKHFSWVIPELTETRNRVAEAKAAVSKTLELTGEFQEDLKAIEKMAQARSPVASNWEEVVENTLNHAQEIPFEEIRTQVVADIQSFRRTIRLSLVRRTKETENRIRERGANLLKKLERGEIEPSQWAVFLRDLRRQVAEQVPDADLRLELEEFLNAIEADSAEKLILAEEKITQRKIGDSLEKLRVLVLDTTQTKLFTLQAGELSALISSLGDSATKDSFDSQFGLFQSDHTEALAQLERARQARTVPNETVREDVPKAEGGESSLMDWRIISAGAIGLVVFLAILDVFLTNKKRSQKGPHAGEIEDVKVHPPETGFGGQQDDLMGMLGGEAKSELKGIVPAVIPTAASSDLEEDPFGISTSEESVAGATSGGDDQIVNLGGEPDSEADNLFGISEEKPSKEISGEIVENRESEVPKTGDEEDPFGFSTVFSDEEDVDSPEILSSETHEIVRQESDDLFSSVDETTENVVNDPGEEPFGLGAESQETETKSDPIPCLDPVEDPLGSSPSDSGATSDEDPFGLLSTTTESALEEASEEKVDDLFESPAPPDSVKDEEEDDIFGFDDYFEDSDSDQSK